MVTRNDVARVAGVSSAVVSYVLNDGPRPVSTSARQRVLSAVEELGYRPNRVARSMRMRTTNSIGFVLPEIALSYFSEMTQRITDIARSRGLSVIVATSNGNLEVEREHLIDLASRQVDGVILMSVDPTQDLGWTGDLGTPVLIVDRPVVAVESMRAAAEHLIGTGRRRIGRLRVADESQLTARRDLGWARALAAHDIHPSETHVVRAGHSEVEAYGVARDLLSLAARPDGIVVDSPHHVMPLLRAAADLDVRIPDDVAVVGLEFGNAGEFTVPRLTSVDSPLEEIAARAVAAITAAGPQDRLLTLDGTDFALTVRESSQLPA